MKKPTTSLIKALFSDKSSFKFAIGVWFGFSFSIAVILCTIGLMDGFDHSLKKGLRKSTGDIYFYGRRGFFDFSDKLKNSLKKLDIESMSAHIQTEAFAVVNEQSRGVSIRGIDGKAHSKIIGIDIHPGNSEAVIGKELAQVFKLNIGDEFVLALGKGNRGGESLPLLKRYKIKKVIEHGIYQKDLRYVYVNKKELSSLLEIGEKVNVVTLSLPQKENQKENMTNIESIIFDLEDILGLDFRIKPYWYDFSTLIEAVEVEKLTIALVLQIIVVISIFNIMAFIIFLNEKRSRELFLFRALGMGQKEVMKVWSYIMFGLWGASCLFSLVLTQFFDWALQNLSLFQLPGDIYHMGRMKIMISYESYLFVFVLALFWLILISFFGLWKMRKNSILHGLRQEFV